MRLAPILAVMAFALGAAPQAGFDAARLLHRAPALLAFHIDGVLQVRQQGHEAHLAHFRLRHKRASEA